MQARSGHANYVIERILCATASSAVAMNDAQAAMALHLAVGHRAKMLGMAMHMMQQPEPP